MSSSNTDTNKSIMNDMDESIILKKIEFKQKKLENLCLKKSMYDNYLSNKKLDEVSLKKYQDKKDKIGKKILDIFTKYYELKLKQLSLKIKKQNVLMTCLISADYYFRTLPDGYDNCVVILQSKDEVNFHERTDTIFDCLQFIRDEMPKHNSTLEKLKDEYTCLNNVFEYAKKLDLDGLKEWIFKSPNFK